jgi:surface antigen
MRKVFIFLFIFLILSGCTNNPLSKKEISQITFSSVAGYLGYQLSDADFLSTLISSSAGYILGDYIGEYLEQNDYYYYKQELLATLDYNEIGASGYWKNNKSQNEGVIIVKDYFKTPNCRLIEHIYVVNNKTKNYYDTACRLDDGRWSTIK